MSQVEGTIDTVEQYVALMEADFEYGFLYHGVGDVDSHPLLPSVGR